MARYIDAEKLKGKLHIGDELMEKFNVNPAVAQLISIEKDIVTEMEKRIDETPTEEVAPLVRGKCSITHGMYENRIWCNNCGFIKVITGEEESYNFCPKCGAIVEESEENQ